MTGLLQACYNGDAAINRDAAKTGTVNKYLFWIAIQLQETDYVFSEILMT